MRHDTNRRAMLGGMAAACLIPAATAVPVADPLLSVIRAYQAGNAAYDRHPLAETDTERAVEETYGPAMDILFDWDEPARTVEGALAALTVALESAEEGSVQANMIRAAMGLLAA